MTIVMKAMYDPDMEDETEAKEAIDFYEWAITDGSYGGGMYEKWKVVDEIEIVNSSHVRLIYKLQYLLVS